MKNRTFTLLAIVITLVSVIGCDTSSNPGTVEPANKFVGTWKAEHIYQSGYTDPVYFPVAADKLNHTIIIKNDGSFSCVIILTYVDNSTARVSYTGTYEYSDNEITLTEVSGESMGSPVPAEELSTTIYLLSEGILTEKDSNSYECSTKDEEGNLLYPIILNFVKQ